MKLIDFLNLIGDFDGEIFSQNLEESRFSFCWNKSTLITESGKAKFSKILNSEIRIKNTNIELLDKEISQNEYDLWMAGTAGYISVKDYDKWFGEVSK